jgi:ATP-dependent Zn protease
MVARWKAIPRPGSSGWSSGQDLSVLLPIANSETFLAELEKAGVPISAKEPKVGIANFLIAALPWIVIIGLWLFLLRQLQAGGSRAFSFGKSKARLLAENPKLTFADVAGCDEAKVELQEIIEFLKDPRSSPGWVVGFPRRPPRRSSGPEPARQGGCR